jgi:NAD(P)-dependent dehydrogenase (short-subunit alcohol dehydrogenase family)
MFTFDLAREFDPVTIAANCLHPATYTATTMVRQSGISQSAPSRKEQKRSSTSLSRKNSPDVQVSSTMG